MSDEQQQDPPRVQSETAASLRADLPETATLHDHADDGPDYRALAQAHLDALAHAAIRSIGSGEMAAEETVSDADLEDLSGEEGPSTAEPFYAAAAQVESLARQLGWLLPLQELALRYGLDPLELDALVWAFVQQTRAEGAPHPTLGEFLTARCDSSAERNAAHALFRSESRLRHWGLLKLVVAPDAVFDNLYQRVMSLPEPVHAFLLGERGLGEGIGRVAKMVRVEPDEALGRGVGQRRIGLPQDAALRDLIVRYIDRLQSGFGAAGYAPQSLVVELCAPPRSGCTSLVRELAREYGALLVELDCTRLVACSPGLQLEILDDIAAVLRLYDAWLVIDRSEALHDQLPALEALAKLTDRLATAFFVTSRAKLPATHPLGARALRHVELQTPEATRQGLWQHALAEEQVVAPNDEDLRLVAAKFDLSAGQIANAARLVALRTPAAGASPEFSELDSSAFEQQRGNLSEVATIRNGRGGLDDLVLPESEKVSIREIIRAATYRTQLLHGWRFKERFSYGTGIISLFCGEPGTGKTFAAEIIAAALDLDLYQIAVPQVVSKWVGETEKQISRIFEEAKSSRALLLFDEADSLFGSRTEVKTASDRYANMATNHLLQAIEAYEGLVILTTNLEENLDAAAERRILFRIRFPFPGAEERAELWRRMLPKGAPLGDDIDFEELGELFELSGGHIKNAIIRAGYEAIERRSVLDMDVLLTAAESQAAMTGRLVRRDEGGVLR